MNNDLTNISEKSKTVKLKYLLISKLQYGANLVGYVELPKGVRYIRITDIMQDGNLKSEGKRFIDLKNASNYLLQKGDILLARSGSVGKVFQFKESLKPACFAGYLIRAKPDPKKCLSDFLYFFTLSKCYDDWISIVSTQATIPNIGANKYAFLPVPIQPIPIQKKIISFLKKRVSTLEKVLRKSETLINLLEEKRQTLITNIVTKGLDLNASMKESRIKWIGDIPSHWKLIKQKFVCKLIMGQSPHSADYNQKFQGFPFLQGKAEFGDEFPSPLIWCKKAKKFSERNDVLLTVRAPVGATNISDQVYAIGRGLCAIRGISIDKKYLYFLSLIYKEGLEQFSVGTTYLAIKVYDVKNLKIPLPPDEEQKKIATQLNGKIKKIQSLKAKLEKQTILLKEYRQTLITNAVTGKLKVNGVRK